MFLLIKRIIANVVTLLELFVPTSRNTRKLLQRFLFYQGMSIKFLFYASLECLLISKLNNGLSIRFTRGNN